MTTTTSTTIDCDTCPVRGRHCGDCFVPVLGRVWLGAPGPGRQAAEPAVSPEGTMGHVPRTTALDPDELGAVGAFVRAGLVEPQEAARARAELTRSAGYAVG